MPGSRQAPDRSKQKARTRQAILDAAVTMLRRGQQPTVAEAAELAGVHRATAYRYFPTPQSLLVDAWLTARAPEPADLYRDVPADDPVALMDAGVRGIAEYMFRDEAMFRSIVQVTLDRWFARDTGDDTDPVPVRETRRFSFIDPALAPLAGVIPEPALRRLRRALTLVFGAEALITMRDVARLDPAQATDVMRWAAATLITGAITQATTQHQPSGTSRRATGIPGTEHAQPDGSPGKAPR
jgi:AcrR family transcriptional regulator